MCSEAYPGSILFTVITGRPVLWVRPGVGGQTESTGQVDFPIVAPTCTIHDENIVIRKDLWKQDI